MEVRTRTESLHDRTNVLRLDAVYDKVAASRHEMAALHDFNFGLAQSQHEFIVYNDIEMLSYIVTKLFHQRIVSLREIAGIDPGGTASAAVDE
jgi:hypothetical protein